MPRTDAPVGVTATRHAMPGVLSLLMAFPAAAALQIDGLPAGQVSGPAGKLRVDAQQVLHFTLEGATVRIAPWPRSLPARLGPQIIRGSNVPRAAGPIRRVVFQHAASTTPWLQLVANAPVGSELLPGWQLLQDDARQLQLASQRGARYALQPGKPRTLQADSGCWQFMLLAAQQAEGAGEGAGEQEARADWYLRKLPRC